VFGALREPFRRLIWKRSGTTTVGGDLSSSPPKASNGSAGPSLAAEAGSWAIKQRLQAAVGTGTSTRGWNGGREAVRSGASRAGSWRSLGGRSQAGASSFSDTSAAIEAGADLVAGNGPHRVQAQEEVDGQPVVYSLGNLVFETGSTAADCWSHGELLEGSLGEKGRILRTETIPAPPADDRVPDSGQTP
jgi:hypothetical protein